VAGAAEGTTTLFRLNSLASKVIKRTSALAGATYLLATLGDPVAKICRNPTGMEVRSIGGLALLKGRGERRWADPYGACGKPAAGPRVPQVDPQRLEVGSSLQANQAKLQAACQAVLDAILAARDTMPPVLRLICGLLYHRVEQRFPGSGCQAVGTTGGGASASNTGRHGLTCRWTAP